MSHDYEKDLEIIEAATAGPWEFGYYNVCSKEEAMELAGLDYDSTKESVGVRPYGYGAFVNGTDIKVSNCGYSDGKSEDNARYISYFNPSYTKQLVEKAMKCDALAKRVEVLELFLTKLHPYMDSIICYASTVNEHEGNMLNKEAEELLK